MRERTVAGRTGPRLESARMPLQLSRMNSAVPIAALLLAFPFMLASQTRPSDAAQAAFAALKQHDWRQLATLIDSPVNAGEFEVSPDQKLASMKAIFEELHQVDGHYAWIDLRFDIPTRPSDGPAQTAQAKVQQ